MKLSKLFEALAPDWQYDFGDINSPTKGDVGKDQWTHDISPTSFTQSTTGDDFWSNKYSVYKAIREYHRGDIDDPGKNQEGEEWQADSDMEYVSPYGEDYVDMQYDIAWKHLKTMLSKIRKLADAMPPKNKRFAYKIVEDIEFAEEELDSIKSIERSPSTMLKRLQALAQARFHIVRAASIYKLFVERI